MATSSIRSSTLPPLILVVNHNPLSSGTLLSSLTSGDIR